MNRYEQRRHRVLDQLQFGEMMVLYSGESVACWMRDLISRLITIFSI